MSDSSGTNASAMTMSQQSAAVGKTEKQLKQLMIAKSGVETGMSVASYYGAMKNERIALENSKVTAGSIGRANQRRLGAMRARFGASGVTMEGSPLEALADQAMEGALDVELAKYAGRVEAAKHKQAGMMAIAGGLSSLAGGLAAMAPGPAAANSIQLPNAQSSGGTFNLGTGSIYEGPTGMTGLV